MILKQLNPRKALNKAFLKVKPNRTDIEAFKANLIALLDRTNDTESEEFHKNLVSDFLKKTYYEPNHFINTKGRNDLVIHNGDKASSTVGVILEAKKPTNKGEMIAAGNINKKAFQELVLYYLRERITHKNLEVKYLIITNINEWFIFDATTFDRLFAQNKALVGQFTDFEEGRLSETKTDFFYKQIAEPFIAKISAEIEFTYFNLQDYQKPLRNDDPSDDHKLIALFKLLSPEHLLKKPFANDSNSLDKRFYSELLHIIGLTETKEGGKKLIQRNQENDRNTGSILEDAIIQLDSLDKLSRLSNLNQFGSTTQDRLFNVALELSITWINRILFLKLLEAQLLSYNNNDASYAFLNFERIKSYDDLNSLFFQVLARKHEDRNADVKNTFAQVPYLNSSLFEPTEIEQDTLFISNLRDDKQLPILPNTVLKDQNGKKRSGKLGTLEYLFEFLNAYDFGAEGSEEIQEDNKTLINASVLGLIFEKINGYKDGSFFTPGFITMYMCRETIRKAVVQKFNEAFAVKHQKAKIEAIPPSEGGRGEDSPQLQHIAAQGEDSSQYSTFTDVYNAIGSRRDFSHEEAAALVNAIKICDPAVGSGHFLVSALNEMIAVKHELGILADREGKFIRDYDIAVENDELVITDANGELFEYKPNNKESQRIQETLFHEKQSIIENCLFGVDINPNSVKICRLRLWIELLKNAYYEVPTAGEGFNSKEKTQARSDSPFGGGAGGGLTNYQRTLQTLPNIDINIKCGNSLVSRFAIDSDLNQALKQSKWNIESYRMAVSTYRTAQNKEQKREMERLIADIKSDFRSNIDNPFKKRISVARGKVDLIATEINTQQQWGEKPSKQLTKELEAATAQLKKLEQEKDEIENNKIFENAFEWRFEFPEVLDNDGKFVGFDVVIGNPPYMRVQEIQASQPLQKLYYESQYQNAKAAYDLANIFFELAVNVSGKNSNNSYIFPHKFFNSASSEVFREYLKKGQYIDEVTHFGANMIFEDADTYTCVAQFSKSASSGFNFQRFPFKSDFKELMHDKESYGFISYEMIERASELYGSNQWILFDDEIGFKVFEKIYNQNATISSKFERVSQGIATGRDELYLFEGKIKDDFVCGNFIKNETPRKIEIGIAKPFLKGKDVQRYSTPEKELFILFPYNLDESGKAFLMKENEIKQKYPNAYQWLKFTEDIHRKKDNKSTNDDFWYRYARNQGVDFIEIPKLSSMEICSKKPNVIFNSTNFYHPTTVYSWVKKEETKESYEYLLAIANSKLLWWFLKITGDTLQGDARRFKTNYLNPFPLPEKVDAKTENKIADKVKMVLEAKKQSPTADTSALESEIDRLVYELYGLTEEEVRIIEGAV